MREGVGCDRQCHGYRLDCSGLCPPLSQYKTLATLGKEPSPESLDGLLFLFTQNKCSLVGLPEESWGALRGLESIRAP